MKVVLNGEAEGGHKAISPCGAFVGLVNASGVTGHFPCLEGIIVTAAKGHLQGQRQKSSEHQWLGGRGWRTGGELLPPSLAGGFSGAICLAVVRDWPERTCGLSKQGWCFLVAPSAVPGKKLGLSGRAPVWPEGGGKSRRPPV